MTGERIESAASDRDMRIENRLEYVISYYGTLKAAGIVVPQNPDLKPDNLGPLLDEVEADFVIFSM